MKLSNFTMLAAVAGIASGIAAADTPAPHEKPGLWQTSMMMAGHPYTTQSCVTEASQAKMSVFSSQSRQKNCSSSTVTHNMDGSWSSASTCKFGPGAARTTHAHVTGDMNSKFTVVVTTDGSNAPDTAMTMTWMGACRPGMQGGDVVMSNGMKMNVLTGAVSGVPAH